MTNLLTLLTIWSNGIFPSLSEIHSENEYSLENTMYFFFFFAWEDPFQQVYVRRNLNLHVYLPSVNSVLPNILIIWSSFFIFNFTIYSTQENYKGFSPTYK